MAGTLSVEFQSVLNECSKAQKMAKDLQQQTDGLVKKFNAAPIKGSKKADQVRQDMTTVRSNVAKCTANFNELATNMRQLVQELDRVAN